MNPEEVIVELISMPEFLQVLGWALAGAMLMGGLFNIDFRSWVSWGFMVVTFIAFEEWARFVLLRNINNPPTLRPVILAVLMALIYGVGVLFGAFLVHQAKKPFKRQREKLAEEVNEDISENVIKSILF